MARYKQGSREWKRWRKTGIGSSDAPIVMGVSPYKTPFELWLERTGRVMEPERGGYAAYLGHQAEPFIRSLYEEKTGNVYQPMLIMSDEFPWQQASVDGAEIDLATVIECKLNNEEKHALAMKGKIPEEHWPQVQHQHSCLPKTSQVIYVSAPYREDMETLKPEDLVEIPVIRDQTYIDQLIIAEATFLEHVATDTPPQLVDADAIVINTPEWNRVAKQWLKANVKFKKYKAVCDILKDALIEMAGNKSVTGAGVTLSRTWVEGRIAYSKIPELSKVDFDKYRGKGSVRWTPSATEKPKKDELE